MARFGISGNASGAVILQGNEGPISIGAPSQPDLTSALKLLDELPLDRVPDPVPLRVPHRMPFTANPQFVGREEDLKGLAALLKGGGSAAIAPALGITGMGGLGKTQLAAEFVHRYGSWFAGGVFWLTLEKPDSVSAELAACAPHLGMAEGSVDEQAGFVRAQWEQGLPRLLVFDNCESEAVFQSARPTGGACRILVTSRRAEWSPALGLTPRPLGLLSPAEAVALLRRFRPDLPAEDPDLAAIAETLGRLPLALHMAGSYLHRYRRAPELGSPAAYRAALAKDSPLAHASLKGCKDASPTGYNRNVAAAFALSFARLDRADPVDALAETLLSAAARCAPGEPIPRWLLTDTAGRLKPTQAAETVEDALARLVELGLLDPDTDGSLSLHRLVAAFVGSVLVAEVAEVARGALEVAALNKARSQLKAGWPAPLLAWEAHLRAVTEAADTAESTWASALLDRLGIHLKRTGRYGQARDLLERTLRIDEAAHGPDHPTIATILSNLASVLQDLGDAAGARPLLERALRINEAAHGPDHPEVATTLGNLATVLYDLGDVAGARPLLERALRIGEAAHGADHPRVAIALSNLATVIQFLGDAAGARPLLERALRIDEAAHGQNHPAVAITLSNLGMVLQNLGDAAGAQPLLERALRIEEAAHGSHHPTIATTLNNLALVLQDLGDAVGARPLLERAVAIATASLGPDHPRTRFFRNNLASLGPAP